MIARATRLALVADGPTDDALQYPIEWAIRKLAPSAEILPWTFLPRKPAGRPLLDMVETARAYEPDLLFVHRDAEGIAYAERRNEIPTANDIVPVIPVRMTEAWLLIDEGAIRLAAGNPSGRAALPLPKVSQLEGLADPKARLVELLMTASEHRGRRRSQFNRGAAVRRLAQSIADYSPLERVPAFRAMTEALADAWAKK